MIMDVVASVAAIPAERERSSRAHRGTLAREGSSAVQ
jgi:hypothetical protein